MSRLEEFRLPDLGEGLTEAELVSWAVAVGDTVALNATIGEVETAKASVELPSPFAGVVRELLVQPGTTVPVGTPIIRVETAGDEDEVPPAPRRDAVLVGYGPSAPTVSRRRRPQPHVSRPPAVRSGAVHARRDAQDARE
ncbi:2-oxo acid dehydrogenase subunit E2, partial [Rhodococcus sp. GG48]|nr:2-oxo acid dehydrogenase subunit E2 [Rhodococcus sp. GG48]